MRNFPLLILWIGTATATLPAYDDFHYPSEEIAERADATLPTVSSISAPSSAVLSLGGSSAKVAVGDVAFGQWHVLSILPDWIALERNFNRWGLLAFVGTSQKPITMRKSVGELTGIRQPFFNFSQDYFDKAASGLDDYLYQQAVQQT